MKHIQGNKDAIIKEMLDEIKTVQAIESEIDTAPIYSKIEALNDKKRRVIDLVLDGTITREDLKRQTEFYDNEIEALSKQIADAENINAVRQQQVQGIQRYIAEISEIMNFNADNELLYREVLDKIVVYTGNTVVVYLNCVPFGVKLHYKTSGRMDNYSVEVDEVEFVGE
jgi:hypothetical protein